MRLPLSLLVVQIVTAIALPAYEQVQQGSPSDDVLVRRMHWPVLVESKRRDADCSGLLPSQVELLGEGRQLTVTRIAARPMRRTHALLIDTSLSMQAMFRVAQKAASAYIDSIPTQDNVMVASFDESMILSAPATTDREAARASIEGLRLGYTTALWDALHDLMRHLASLPEEKIVVLISDGEDSTGLASRSFRDVLDLATSTPDLTVFAIRIAESSAAAAAKADDVVRLERLAGDTGGELFAGAGSRLEGILQTIDDRLEQRLYVAYDPLPSGDPAPADGRRPRLKIRVRDGLPCRIVPLGVPRRWRGGPKVTLEPASARPDLFPGTVETLRVTASRDLGDDPFLPATLALTATREGILGRANDLVRDTEPLFKSEPYARKGKLIVDPGRPERFERRSFEVETPALERLRSRNGGAADVLLRMLEQDDGSEAAFLINGRTFLALRDAIGLAMLRHRPEYRSWAVERLAADVDDQLETIAGPSGWVELSPERREALRAALLARDTDPIHGRAQSHLAAWLGDLPAARAAGDLERQAVDLLLAQAEASNDVEIVRRVDESWNKLAQWLGPATSTRIVTPLFPVYDPAGDQVGFYRFVLPRPRFDGTHPTILPDKPLGLALVRWLLRRPEAGVAPGEWQSASLEYRRVKRRQLRGILCDFPRERRAAELNVRGGAAVEVRLQLDGRDARAGKLYVSGYFGTSGKSTARAPFCAAVQRYEDATDRR